MAQFNENQILMALKPIHKPLTHMADRLLLQK